MSKLVTTLATTAALSLTLGVTGTAHAATTAKSAYAAKAAKTGRVTMPDVFVSRCVKDSAGVPQATVRFINRTGVTMSWFMVKVTFRDTRGNFLSQDYVSAVNVPANKTATATATAYSKYAGTPVCTVDQHLSHQ